MRLEYVVIVGGRVLDTVTLPEDGTGEAQYATGRARGTVEMVLRRAGAKALPGWTNGYVQLRRA